MSFLILGYHDAAPYAGCALTQILTLSAASVEIGKVCTLRLIDSARSSSELRLEAIRQGVYSLGSYNYTTT